MSDAAKAIIAPWRSALYNLSGHNARGELKKIAKHAKFRMCYPFGDFDNSERFYDHVFDPLEKAIPDLERRDYIVISGSDEDGANWVGTAGYYTGTFLSPWLDIPPTGHQIYLRFHEFYRIEDDGVVEVQAIWDIPSLMQQANAWPMTPSLGLEWHVPAPSSQDGLFVSGTKSEAQSTRQHIIDMLEHMIKHPKLGPEAMEMERFWHGKMNWYGPAGIGTARGISGFRHWHQIPFLRAMPDRGNYPDETGFHFIAEGQYAAVTGWPNMAQTLSHAGWLGLPPIDKKITLRSLDFWRLENGKIRENWVLVDLLDMYDQIGIDVFARMGDFNLARNLGGVQIEKDYKC